MKRKLSIGVCILISLALVVFGLIFGTIRGYNEERAQVTQRLDKLEDVLGYMAGDGHNLCVVAGRHLQDDEDVKRLSIAAGKLGNAQNTLKEREKGMNELSDAARAVSEKLGKSASFLQSKRDVEYLKTILNDLDEMSNSQNIENYNAAVDNYNESLKDPVGGFLASILGIKRMEHFGGEQQ